MAVLFAFSLLAAAPLVSAHVPTKAAAAAQASVRILKPARVRLGAEPQPDGRKLQAATVTVENGSRRPAQLVEFQ